FACRSPGSVPTPWARGVPVTDSLRRKHLRIGARAIRDARSSEYEKSSVIRDPPRPSVAEAVVPYLVEKCPVGEVEEARGARAIAARALERAPDEPPLQLLGAALDRKIVVRGR